MIPVNYMSLWKRGAANVQEIHRATHPAKLEREKCEMLETLAAEDDGAPEPTDVAGTRKQVRVDGGHRHHR